MPGHRDILSSRVDISKVSNEGQREDQCHGRKYRGHRRWLLAVLHYLVLCGLSIAAIAVLVAGFFTVLITGEYPEQFRVFPVAVYRYSVRVRANTGLLTDQYPPFSLQAG